jgi:hypothetical protein
VREQGPSPRSERMPRSERFEIATSVRYRLRGEWKWREGTTKNISRAGVLISTDRFIEAGTVIEIRFVLPVELTGEDAAEVVTRAVVVRSTNSETEPGCVLVASRIDRAKLLRQAV